MPKKTPVQRVRDLKPRFARIKAAIMASDAMMDDFYTRRAEEIEAFNDELQSYLKPEDKPTEKPVN